MPTQHRQEMIAAGYTAPHHGHARAAVRAAAALEAENQRRLDAFAAAEVEAQKTARKAFAQKQAERAARHEAELAARRGRRINRDRR